MSTKTPAGLLLDTVPSTMAPSWPAKARAIRQKTRLLDCGGCLDADLWPAGFPLDCGWPAGLAIRPSRLTGQLAGEPEHGVASSSSIRMQSSLGAVGGCGAVFAWLAG